MLFRADTSVAALAHREFAQHFPASGEVEHEPEDLWATTLETCRGAMRDAGARGADIAAIGIANQRETTLLWHRATGRALHRAIVWQDRRSAGLCAKLKEAGHEPEVTAKTGLVLDPYFPAASSRGSWRTLRSGWLRLYYRVTGQCYGARIVFLARIVLSSE
jgi:glycerol kinase